MSSLQDTSGGSSSSEAPMPSSDAVQNAAHSAPPMPEAADEPFDIGEDLSLGRFLYNARADKGVSLEELSEKIRIPVATLQALESDDSEHLPGRIFVVGFIRAYARRLGFDEKEAIRRYDQSQKISVTPTPAAQPLSLTPRAMPRFSLPPFFSKPPASAPPVSSRPSSVPPMSAPPSSAPALSFSPASAPPLSVPPEDGEEIQVRTLADVIDGNIPVLISLLALIAAVVVCLSVGSET